MSYEYLIVENKGDGVALIQLNRPKQLNALCTGLLDELGAVLNDFNQDDTIRSVVITGNERAFAAGADIAELADLDAVGSRKLFQDSGWAAIERFRKPIIAAVQSLALGGGFELVLQCDMVIISDDVKLGLPEVNLGVIPGAGGTQRVARAAGKVLAMEMVLNGRNLNAEEALTFGLANHACPSEEVVGFALKTAKKLASRAPLAVEIAKQCINAAFEEPLSTALLTEQSGFHFLFSTEDRKEGFHAFLEKRQANWKNK